jgi:dTDP-4-dehydrorhamnose 3,5-epimerase
MKFSPAKLPGLWIIDLERHEDERGFFARAWCLEEFAAHGLNPRLMQCNISFNKRQGTLRGLHFQSAPHAETKIVRCTRGAIYDVAVDLRPDSPAFKQWFAVELNEENSRMLYVPEGFAHGFQTLRDDTEVLYQMSASFHPESARGIRWNDPAFQIDWPKTNERIISKRDAGFPDFRNPSAGF